MPKLLVLLLIIILILPACAQAPTITLTTVFSTATPLPIGTATTTSSPDALHTRAASYDRTATIRALTPSPTLTINPTSLPSTRVPTITPTFDPSSQPSFTPAPPAQCPQVFPKNVPSPDFIMDGVFTIPEDKLLAYLNTYGQEPLLAFLKNFMDEDQRALIINDLTHDGVPELIFSYGWSFYILGCQNQQYRTLLSLEPDGLQSPAIGEITDANRNGVPELTLLVYIGSQGGKDYRILEWDGSHFGDVIENWLEPETEGVPSVYLRVNSYGRIGTEDINQDGILEYRVDVRTAVWDTFRFGIPWREETQYFRWNGTHYVFEHSHFSAPEYRFQAVQDGDRAMLDENYDQALDLYQQVIFSDQLKWWTAERYNQISEAYFNTLTLPLLPTPTLSAPDPLEYDFLAAYARYKIMVLHAARGWASDAQTVYDTLQTKYPEGKPGHIHAMTATAFWNEYQATQDAGLACQAALAFANQHKPEIIRYLTAAGSLYPRDIDYFTHFEYICPIGE